MAILDADKEGFLRSETSLGTDYRKSARNAQGRVIMYAEQETESIRNAIKETNRRRQIQNGYNITHGITPTSIQKKVRDLISISKKVEQDINDIEKDLESMSKQELNDMVKKITKQMHTAAAELNFELAAELRDKMIEIKKHLLDF